MILNIIIGNENNAADELRLEANTFLIRPANIIYEVIEGKKGKIAMCAEASLMLTTNPPQKLPFWLVSHNDKIYCFQNAFLTNKEGKTIQRYG